MPPTDLAGGNPAWTARIEVLARNGLRVLVGPQVDHAAAAEVAELIDQMAGTLAQVPADVRGCVHAGLWLLADDLEKAHGICQGIATAHGSAWHAVMHRREGDFSNAKYWWRRAGPLDWADLGGRLQAALAGAPAESLRCVRGGRYDPVVFVDLVEKHRSGSAELQEALVRVQRLEWWSLFRQSGDAR